MNIVEMQEIFERWFLGNSPPESYRTARAYRTPTGYSASLFESNFKAFKAGFDTAKNLDRKA